MRTKALELMISAQSGGVHRKDQSMASCNLAQDSPPGLGDQSKICYEGMISRMQIFLELGILKCTSFNKEVVDVVYFANVSG
ncbi:hypothetical protein CEXT_151191 [Caerostris extrusa]|uniref:Uncharacterized protein n=1 Tax=Caerostris extrusa TaxID=172846 RepID=A0AAV4XYC2_CAEEX|nr:hypothetical protein CEXT_151191 [Caerostris extrusa]